MKITNIKQNGHAIKLETDSGDFDITRYNFKVGEEKTPISKIMNASTPKFWTVRLVGVTFPSRVSGRNRQDILKEMFKSGEPKVLTIDAETENEELMAIDPLAVSVRLNGEDLGFIPSVRRDLQGFIHDDKEDYGEVSNYIITGYKIIEAPEDQKEGNFGIKVYVGRVGGLPITLQEVLGQNDVPDF